MLIERTLTNLEFCNHALTATRTTDLLMACLRKLGLPSNDFDLYTGLKELLFLLLSLRALRPEGSIELEALEQRVVLHMDFDPAPGDSGEDPWRTPELAPLPPGSDRPCLTLHVEPAYAALSDLQRRVELLQEGAPVVVQVRSGSPAAATRPLLLQPMEVLERVLDLAGHPMTPDLRKALEDDLRQWQREEAFRRFTVSRGPARAVLPAEADDGRVQEVVDFLGEDGEPRIGVVLVAPYTERSGWEAWTTEFGREWGSGDLDMATGPGAAPHHHLVREGT